MSDKCGVSSGSPALQLRRLGGATGGDKNGIKLMRLWKLYKIRDNPRLDFNKMRKFYNKPLLTQIFLLTKFPVLLMSEVTKSGEWSQITGKKVKVCKMLSVKCQWSHVRTRPRETRRRPI